MRVQFIADEVYEAELSDEIANSVQSDLDSGMSVAEVIGNVFASLAYMDSISLDQLSHAFNLPYMAKLN